MLGYFCTYVSVFFIVYFFFFKQKTAYEMRISDWSSDVCSSDLLHRRTGTRRRSLRPAGGRTAAPARDAALRRRLRRAHRDPARFLRRDAARRRSAGLHGQTDVNDTPDFRSTDFLREHIAPTMAF